MSANLSNTLESSGVAAVVGSIMCVSVSVELELESIQTIRTLFCYLGDTFHLNAFFLQFHVGVNFILLEHHHLISTAFFVKTSEFLAVTDRLDWFVGEMRKALTCRLCIVNICKDAAKKSLFQSVFAPHGSFHQALARRFFRCSSGGEVPDHFFDFPLNAPIR